MRSLTPRQQRIADLAVLGMTNGEIAGALKVTPAVVLAELEALYRKSDGGKRDPARCPTERRSGGSAATWRLEDDDE